MNIFNRIVVIVGSIFIIIGSVILFLITVGLGNPQEWLSAPWHEIFIPFTQLNPSRGWSVIGLCLGGLMMGVLLLWLELRLHPNKLPELVVEKDALGDITASVTSIQDLANREAEKIEGVRKSLTHVKNSSGGILLKCRLSVDSQTNASEIGQQVQERIKAAVEHFLGKPVRGINLQTQIAPLTKNSKGIRSHVH